MDASTRELLDREIMLSCLAAAADEQRTGDFQAGARGRRVLDVRLRSTRARRHAAARRAGARAMRPARVFSARPEAEIQAVPRALESRLMMARIVRELNRASLLANRADAADLRSSAAALRAQAQHVLRRAQDRRR